MARTNLYAWKEIISRIFEGLEVKQNLSPTWLVNPSTNRRLKLDYVYPEIGVAVWFQGLSPQKKRRRDSLEEEIQQRNRDTARKTLCRSHGLNLAILNLSSNDFQAIFAELELALSHATIQLRKDETISDSEKSPLLENLSEMRLKVSEFKRKIKAERDLSLYNNLWQDRQYQALEPSNVDATLPTLDLAEAMLIEHTRFGTGLIVSITPSGDDTLVTIEFEADVKKTFMGSLLGDKVKVVSD